MDLLGPLPRTQQGNRYILSVMDYFSKWVETIPLPNIEAATVARAFVDQWVCRYGVPTTVHTDQGRQFEAALFKDICNLLDIHKTRTAPFNPRSDGMVERFHRTLEAMLAKTIKKQEDWDLHLQSVTFAYRSTKHDSIRATPAKVMFGRDLRVPADLALGVPPSDSVPLPINTSFGDSLQQHLQRVHAAAREQLQRAAQSQQRWYDPRSHHIAYNVGDCVFVYQPARKRGVSPKLVSPWSGPYRIVKRLSDLIYQVQASAHSRPFVVHHDRLKKSHLSIPSWTQGSSHPSPSSAHSSHSSAPGSSRPTSTLWSAPTPSYAVLRSDRKSSPMTGAVNNFFRGGVAPRSNNFGLPRVPVSQGRSMRGQEGGLSRLGWDSTAPTVGTAERDRQTPRTDETDLTDDDSAGEGPSGLSPARSEPRGPRSGARSGQAEESSRPGPGEARPTRRGRLTRRPRYLDDYVCFVRVYFDRLSCGVPGCQHTTPRSQPHLLQDHMRVAHPGWRPNNQVGGRRRRRRPRLARKAHRPEVVTSRAGNSQGGGGAPGEPAPSGPVSTEARTPPDPPVTGPTGPPDTDIAHQAPERVRVGVPAPFGPMPGSGRASPSRPSLGTSRREEETSTRSDSGGGTTMGGTLN